MVSWAPKKKNKFKKGYCCVSSSWCWRQVGTDQIIQEESSYIIFELVPGCPVKVTGTRRAGAARRAQRSFVAAVSIGGGGESKPQMWHSRANMMHAKSTSYSVMKVEQIFPPELEITICYLLFLKKNNNNWMLPLISVPVSPNERCRAFQSSSLGLLGTGGERWYTHARIPLPLFNILPNSSANAFHNAASLHRKETPPSSVKNIFCIWKQKIVIPVLEKHVYTTVRGDRHH